LRIDASAVSVKVVPETVRAFRSAWIVRLGKFLRGLSLRIVAVDVKR